MGNELPEGNLRRCHRIAERHDFARLRLNVYQCRKGRQLPRPAVVVAVDRRDFRANRFEFVEVLDSQIQRRLITETGQVAGIDKPCRTILPLGIFYDFFEKVFKKRYGERIMGRGSVRNQIG